MDKAWYKDWFGTPYYAMLYGNRDDAEAQEQVEGIIALTGSRPGSRVLDMACGRGRHARCFLSKGMEVTGFDVNPTAIEVAVALRRKRISVSTTCESTSPMLVSILL
ncbi:MAG: methyltransferase domain-containing protein [Flavobacteriales bacterium]|nr:methyltransferase domain-containing protein [Flavobacteriales bacterium]